MPLYKWNEIEDTLITPSRTRSKGKTIVGKRLILQRIVHDADRGDGFAGATSHSHPEEQIFIPLKGNTRIRVKNEWFTVGPMDVFVVPPDIEHEEICDMGSVWLNIKSRIPGHSWYDRSWKAGAEEEWKNAKAILDEMDKNYKETTPWNE